MRLMLESLRTLARHSARCCPCALSGASGSLEAFSACRTRTTVEVCGVGCCCAPAGWSISANIAKRRDRVFMCELEIIQCAPPGSFLLVSDESNVQIRSNCVFSYD